MGLGHVVHEVAADEATAARDDDVVGPERVGHLRPPILRYSTRYLLKRLVAQAVGPIAPSEINALSLYLTRFSLRPVSGISSRTDISPFALIRLSTYSLPLFAAVPETSSGDSLYRMTLKLSSRGQNSDAGSPSSCRSQSPLECQSHSPRQESPPNPEVGQAT